MDVDRWRQVTRIYAAVATREPGARANALDAACGGDADLRREVESLLAEEGASAIIDRAVGDRPSLLNMATAVTIGTQIGVFRIDSLLGVGGMGEVYRARDTKLNRDVAIKILPPAFASDPDRLARFKREAQVLASLNHPHIAAIYGFEDSGDVHALVLELVEGPTVADRLARPEGRALPLSRKASVGDGLETVPRRSSAIPIDEALAIARQIAEALEAAHEQGIIHRDLKPANIKVREDGTVKVLDFGLAKVAEVGGAGGARLRGDAASARQADVTNSPTITTPAMTAAGMILGTAAYMAPEQAKGKPADNRSDIWAFGCVLYEMLTGNRAFEGEDVSDTLATILRGEPAWSALPVDLDARVTGLLRRCLQKDSRKRWQAAGDLRFELETMASEPRPASDGVVSTGPPRSKARSLAAITGVAAVSAVLAAAAVRFIGPASSAPPASLVRLALTLPNPTLAAEFGVISNTVGRALDISADGRAIVFALNRQPYLRTLADPVPRRVGDLSGAASSVFSPDGQSLAYWSVPDRSLKRVALAGGVSTTICSMPSGSTLTWSGDSIVFSQSGGVFRVTSAGGTPERLIDVKDPEMAQSPQLLPGGEAVLFTLLPNSSAVRPTDRGTVVVESLSTHERRMLAEGNDARYVPTGHVVYALGGAILAAPFDVARLQLKGSPVTVLEGVRRTTGGTAMFAVSETGILAYVQGPSFANTNELFFVDRSGNREPLPLPPGSYESPRVSPDGKWLAFDKDAAIYVYALDGKTAPQRLTSGGRNHFPVWSGDGTRIVYQSDRDGDLAIFWQRFDGSDVPQRLTRPEPGITHVPESWQPGGSVFSFSVIASVGTSSNASPVRATGSSGASLWTFSVADGKATRFGEVTSTGPLNSVFSPDGGWIAYGTRGAGRADLWLSAFPPTGSAYPVPSDLAGHHPMWDVDGSSLFYFPGAGAISSITLTLRPTVRFSAPTPMPRGFAANTSQISARNSDLTRDGKRFITVGDRDTTDPTEIEFVLNWFEDLKRLAPPR